MIYIVYTDGSCRPEIGRAAYSYIIRTKTTCVNIKYSSYVGRHILEAEITAVKEAIKFLINNKILSEGDTIKFFIDSLYTLKAYNSVLKDKELPSNIKPEIMIEPRALVKKAVETGAKLYFNKVDAHQEEFNTNKACDSLAKIALIHNL